MTKESDLEDMQHRLDDLQEHIDEVREAAEDDGLVEGEEPEPTFFAPDPEHHHDEADDRGIAPPG